MSLAWFIESRLLMLIGQGWLIAVHLQNRDALARLRDVR